ncbi:MAG: hypothetical protein K8S98_09005 [Planctomycetes bacterium]|nr:hypothetical protein [Planctomycetota bacterium]
MVTRSSFALGATLVASTVAWCSPLFASSEKSNPCKKTAAYADTACRKEASSAYWTERAKCINLTDVTAREDCIDAAIGAFDEALDDCKEQYAARIDLCKALGSNAYDPLIDPADYVVGISNPLMPLVPGTTLVYENSTPEGLETINYMITHQTKTILGVECIVVHDVADLDGVVIEDTFDWFAQDVDGNVWYFGEFSIEYEGGVLVGFGGSWEAGVDGAKPGIVMQASPIVGEVYRQEFLVGEAEDVAGVLGLAANAVVPLGSYANCLQTEDYTPIEPGHVENKYYAPGVGLVLSTNPETGSREELVAITTN